jgi:alkylhydroperoxidase family enzyme
MTGSFLEEPAASPEVQALFDEDIKDDGYVWNVTRLWAHQPETVSALFDLMSRAFKPSRLSFRQRGILVVATASALGDSYCSLAWSGKLGHASSPALATAVLTNGEAVLTNGETVLTNGETVLTNGAAADAEQLSEQEEAMAAWARKVARDPNATTPADIQALRETGLDDGQIFAITAFVALRLAFSTINDALGAQPDAQLVESLPPAVRAAVTFGRPPASAPSGA